MRRCKTFSQAIRSGYDQAWEFISNPDYLHLWTVDFALGPPVRTNDAYIVHTPRGPRELKIISDRGSGIIDFYFGREGIFACSPSRLIANGDGVIYIFTQFEPVDAPSGLFETLLANVEKEMEILQKLLEHPTKITTSDHEEIGKKV